MNENALGLEQGAFERLAASIAAEPAIGGDHAMARHVRAPAVPHDIAHGPRSAGFAGPGGHLPVTDDGSWRNATHHGEDSLGEGEFHRSQQSTVDS